jgi:hypothetical protein
MLDALEQPHISIKVLNDQASCIYLYIIFPF